jgi:hypothetical protein
MRSFLIKTFDESTGKMLRSGSFVPFTKPGEFLTQSVVKPNSRNPNQRGIHYDADHTQLKNKGMPINFNNLIVGRHESKVLFMWNPQNGVAMLGAFLGIKIGIEAILARDGITPAQRVILEEFRAIVGKNNWDFATLRDSLS